MLQEIILVCHIIVSLIYLIALTIIIPRISKNAVKKPFIYFLGFYFVSTFVLSYINGMSSSNTIVTNLLLLAFGHIIGLKLRLLGLTGQICSGKSLAVEYLCNNYCASVIENESLLREVLKSDYIKNEIIKTLGDRILNNEYNDIDMLKMKEVLINEPKLAYVFQSLIHTTIYWYLFKTILYQKFINKKKFIFFENDLLFTLPILNIICFPILSICSENKEVLLSRIQHKYNIDKKQAIIINQAQYSFEEYHQKSDNVIINDGEIRDFYIQIDRFMANINL